MWTNKGVKEIFDNYGERVFAIHLNNSKKLLLGYNGTCTTSIKDISFETIGGCDVLKIKKRNISHGKELTFDSYVTTEFIESIDIMSEKDANYRIDPLVL